MSDTYTPPEPAPEPQPSPPLEAIDPVPTKEGAFTAFPNATEASVQAAEVAFKDGTAEGVVVNPGPQIGMPGPDEQPSEPALPPPEPTA